MKQALSILLLGLFVLTALGCEQDFLNKPKTEARSMVIAGVPVQERDYRLSPHETAYNEALSDDD
ncbi:NF038215 family lipoprotein [Acinetobacter sp. YH12239]|uniref:NF038215 family lipoprotein n=1 Tax=Acinetobacter sp. YH12239 TaxID=2601166 RepID=UPI0015D3336A|nr:NF038215 family lipoprotein [Acinetobacter sp. YH12239]